MKSVRHNVCVFESPRGWYSCCVGGGGQQSTSRCLNDAATHTLKETFRTPQALIRPDAKRLRLRGKPIIQVARNMKNSQWRTSVINVTDAPKVTTQRSGNSLDIARNTQISMNSLPGFSFNNVVHFSRTLFFKWPQKNDEEPKIQIMISGYAIFWGSTET